MIDVAASMIRNLEFPSEAKITVLFDKFYLSQKVVFACKLRGFSFIGGAKSNRRFTPLKKNEKRVGTYSRTIVMRQGKNYPWKH